MPVPDHLITEANAGHDLAEAVERIAGWIERDRREPDKVLCHLNSLHRAVLDSRLGALDNKEHDG